MKGRGYDRLGFVEFLKSILSNLEGLTFASINIA